MGGAADIITNENRRPILNWLPSNELLITAGIITAWVCLVFRRMKGIRYGPVCLMPPFYQNFNWTIALRMYFVQWRTPHYARNIKCRKWIKYLCVYVFFFYFSVYVCVRYLPFSMHHASLSESRCYPCSIWSQVRDGHPLNCMWSVLARPIQADDSILEAVRKGEELEIETNTVYSGCPIKIAQMLQILNFWVVSSKHCALLHIAHLHGGG